MTEQQDAPVEPPTCLPEERTVLGAMMIDAATIPVVLSMLETLDFYPTAHQLVFDAVKAINKDGGPVDLVSISGYLKRIGRLDQVGGSAYLATFEQNVLTTQNIGWYCKTVKEFSTKRAMKQSAQMILDNIGKGKSLSDLTNQWQKTIDTASSAGNGCKPMPTMRVDEIFDIKIEDEDSFVGDNMIAAGELALLVGAGNIGKSRLANQLIFDIICGSPDWLGSLKIHRHNLKILLFQTENNLRRLKHDFGAQMKGIWKEERDRVKNQLEVYVPKTVDDAYVALDDPLVIERLSRTVIAFEPDLIIFDPWAAFNPSESENDAIQTQRAVSTLMKVAHAWSNQTAVLLIHHARGGRVAAAGAEGWDKGQFARGSKALYNAARSQINLLPGDENGDTILVACGKNNNGPEFKPFAVRLNPDNMLYQLADDFDIDEWKRQVNAKSPHAAGRKRKVTETILRGLMMGNKVYYRILMDSVKEAAECSESAAKSSLKHYVDTGFIVSDSDGMYRLKGEVE